MRVTHQELLPTCVFKRSDFWFFAIKKKQILLKKHIQPVKRVCCGKGWKYNQVFCLMKNLAGEPYREYLKSQQHYTESHRKPCRSKLCFLCRLLWEIKITSNNTPSIIWKLLEFMIFWLIYDIIYDIIYDQNIWYSGHFTHLSQNTAELKHPHEEPDTFLLAIKLKKMEVIWYWNTSFVFIVRLSWACLTTFKINLMYK